MNEEGVNYKKVNNFLFLEWNLSLKHNVTDIIKEIGNMVEISMTSLIWFVGETKRNIWIKNEKLRKLKVHCLIFVSTIPNKMFKCKLIILF